MNIALLRSLNEIISRRDERFIEFAFYEKTIHPVRLRLTPLNEGNF